MTFMSCAALTGCQTSMLQRELWIHSKIQVHQGKTQLWKEKPTSANPVLAKKIWPIHFGPNHFWPIHFLVCVMVGLLRVGPCSVGGPKFRAFFPSPTSIFIFFSLWVSFRGILVVLEAPGPCFVPVWTRQPQSREDPEEREDRMKSEILGGPGEGGKMELAKVDHREGGNF